MDEVSRKFQKRIKRLEKEIKHWGVLQVCHTVEYPSRTYRL